MEKPVAIEKIQIIAVMRVLDCSQDAVRSILGIRSEKVVMTEEWLRNEDIRVVYNVLEDQALKSTVMRELSAFEEIDHTLLVRAGQVTCDAILRHYGRIQAPTTACLHIGAPSVDVYSDGIYVARYASVEITATTLEAKECWAWVDVIPTGPSLPLHWVGTPYTSEETTTARIMIRPEKPARLDVAVSIPPTNRASADLYRDALPCGDVAIFLPGGHPWNGEGCWLAQPLALDNPDLRLEAYLVPGDYKLRIQVGCDNGEGDSKEFILHSTSSWENLAIINV
jgi:hypothetical protein